jgi:hypothetical protein
VVDGKSFARRRQFAVEVVNRGAQAGRDPAGGAIVHAASQSGENTFETADAILEADDVKLLTQGRGASGSPATRSGGL